MAGQTSSCQYFRGWGLRYISYKNVVPFIVIGEGKIGFSEGRLADIAPIMLDIMNVEKSEEITKEFCF